MTRKNTWINGVDSPQEPTINNTYNKIKNKTDGERAMSQASQPNSNKRGMGSHLFLKINTMFNKQYKSKWTELEEFIREHRQLGVSSKFKIKTTSSEIIVEAYNKPHRMHKTIRIKTINNL